MNGTPTHAAPQHETIDPAILYFGTPVVLLSTVDSDGHPNLAPMSSVFWLGHTAVIGMGARSQTARNLAATGQCVLNLPSSEQVSAVNRLALTTGRPHVPPGKHAVGYRYVANKFAHAHLTPVDSELVTPPRVAECPVHLEGTVLAHRELSALPHESSPPLIFDIAISRVHVESRVRLAGHTNRIDPDAWRPLIMSFQRFYGLGAEAHSSRLASIDEEWYR